MKATLDFNKFKKEFKTCYELYKTSSETKFEFWGRWVDEMVHSIETLVVFGIITEEEFTPYQELFKEYGYYGG